MKILAENQKPDCLVLSETHLTKDKEGNKTTAQGYGQITTASDSTRKGDISIYYRKNQKVRQIVENTKDLKY